MEINSDKKLSGFFRALSETGKPLILYELKTFVKPKEKLQIKSSYKKIIPDFKKLNDGVLKYELSRGYFILVCKSKDLKNRTL